MRLWCIEPRPTLSDDVSWQSVAEEPTKLIDAPRVSPFDILLFKHRTSSLLNIGAQLKRLFPVTWGHYRSAALARLFPYLFRARRASGLIRLGTFYGGSWVPALGLGEDSVCYLAGVGEDISFDLELIERFGCQVISLDPTPKAIDFVHAQSTPKELRFVPEGLAGSDREARFYVPRDASHASFSMSNLQGTEEFVVGRVRALSSLMKEMGHERIDLLKLNIEGAEYEVLDSLFREHIYPDILCVVFDQPHPFPHTWRTFQRLRRVGYKTVSVELFNVTFLRTAGAAD